MATEDTMENGWGVKYVTYTEKRSGRQSFNGFSRDIEKAVDGFTLHSVQMCGTDANAVAISLATNCEYSRCLFGIGSYIGGDELHQSLSSSGYQINSGLALPKSYTEACPQCQEQTVPLPYHVPCEWLDNKSLDVYENRCLLHLHYRLLLACFIGKPIRAILLEYILGGNGGELSVKFLRRLGHLLQHFNVAVVVDEILTGGRVGPDMTMTTGMPAVFLECVQSITMGKIMGCGLVLVKKPKTVQELPEVLRGFSTQAECGLPSKLFDEVVKRIQAGMIQQRRNEVLKLMGCLGADKEEDHWGQGTQIYTTYSRGSVLQGLRNRCLPRLERSKLKKNSAVRSKWTRKTVCMALVGSVDEWILCQHARTLTGEHAFKSSLVFFLIDKISTHGRSEDRYVNFRTEEVENFLGKKGEEMAREHNDYQLKAKGRRCNAQPITLIKRAIIDAMANTKDTRLIYKKRVNFKRTTINCFDAETFDIYNK